MVEICPTLRLVCDKCGDDLRCNEKGIDGFAYRCEKCDVKIHLLTGWLSYRPMTP